ncbi:hypothetical protein T265_13121 [Opisthorchis viverrini]|uniref:Geminin n=1 Tax=Opisthorchis viverrini TaxID=6198 RepID=A0A075A528_OPIVI|nr:hypothetical protein T265_13121 [Opisthorchis viverrini]KER30665.1 hypothetical protein T265_13121 [Opisthorchis viverrini]
MATVRKGLALRNNIVEHLSKEPTKASVKKSPVTKPTVSAKTGPKVPFKIFEDPVSANCQHCGSERRKPSLPCRERVSTTSVGVQACDTDIREWLCAEKPTEGYWEELAERRRVALKETLDENRELCTLVESLNKEIERLNQIEQQAEHFARMYKALKEASEQMPSDSS